jgi:hypothetical protein
MPSISAGVGASQFNGSNSSDDAWSWMVGLQWADAVIKGNAFGIGLGEIVMVGAQVTFLGVIAGATTAALAVGRYAKATEGAETGWWQRPVGRTVKQRSAGKGVNLDAGVARAGSAQSEETQLVDIKTAVFEEHEWVVEREEETSR